MKKPRRRICPNLLLYMLRQHLATMTQSVFVAQSRGRLRRARAGVGVQLHFGRGHGHSVTAETTLDHAGRGLQLQDGPPPARLRHGSALHLRPRVPLLRPLPRVRLRPLLHVRLRLRPLLRVRLSDERLRRGC